jgi:hypothetical protein
LGINWLVYAKYVHIVEVTYITREKKKKIKITRRGICLMSHIKYAKSSFRQTLTTENICQSLELVCRLSSDHICCETFLFIKWIDPFKTKIREYFHLVCIQVLHFVSYSSNFPHLSDCRIWYVTNKNKIT